jgi:toxin-antitoxin system PIN domain toxin
MLVDANVLLYSVDESSPFHDAALQWMVSALNGPRQVGLPWNSLWAFVRIATNPRAVEAPLSPEVAWGYVESWLDAPAAWVPAPGARHRTILQDLLKRHDLRACLVSDAVLAAICLEHGLSIVSADSDFARFPEITWVNPLARP